MTEQHSIAAARSKLSQLVRQAESGQVVELTRRNEIVAVLIGRKQYERLISRPQRFSEAWETFIGKVSLADLKIDPDEIFAGVRDKARGR